MSICIFIWKIILVVLQYEAYPKRRYENDKRVRFKYSKLLQLSNAGYRSSYLVMVMSSFYAGVSLATQRASHYNQEPR